MIFIVLSWYIHIPLSIFIQNKVGQIGGDFFRLICIFILTIIQKHKTICVFNSAMFFEFWYDSVNKIWHMIKSSCFNISMPVCPLRSCQRLQRLIIYWQIIYNGSQTPSPQKKITKEKYNRKCIYKLSYCEG